MVVWGIACCPWLSHVLPAWDNTSLRGWWALDAPGGWLMQPGYGFTWSWRPPVQAGGLFGPGFPPARS